MTPVVTPDNERWAIFEDQVLALGFTQVPNVITRNPRLSMSAKYLYGLLLSYAWEDPYSFPGQARLKNDAGVKKTDTLRPYLYELRDAGVLDIIRRGQGKTNLYIFKALVQRERNPETRSTGFQETRPAGYPETRHTGRNKESVTPESATHNQSSKKGREKVRAADLNDVADKWDHLTGQEPFGEYLLKMAEILAEGNTTGVVAVTRCWRELAEPFMRYYQQEPMKEEAWMYGFDAALRRGVSNIRYVRNAARNWTPAKSKGKKGENGAYREERTRSRKDEFRELIEG